MTSQEPAHPQPDEPLAPAPSSNLPAEGAASSQTPPRDGAPAESATPPESGPAPSSPGAAYSDESTIEPTAHEEIASTPQEPAPPPARPTDQQQTVISKNPPLSVGGPNGRSAEFAAGLLGQRLGHFELQELVGGGGMGVVFRALDTMLGRTVAVKVLSREQNADQETVRRFKNEAQSAARLDHDNIARVYYVGEDRGWNYIVFEYIQGENIRDLVERTGPLQLDEAITYTLQVAEALNHAARRDVVHRDIKPSNVLVMADRKAKLVDMGLARLHQVASEQDDLTASGVTLGTFDYISPEQARDPRSADVRSDLYSLGCTFYFMLTGRPPFPEGTVLQKLLSHSSDEPPDPRDVRPDLPEEVTEILGKLLSKNPAHRYQEPSELIGQLLLLADRLSLAVAQRGGTVWITRSDSWLAPIERHLPWVVPLAALLLTVGGIRLLADWSGPAAEPLPPFQLPVMAVEVPGNGEGRVEPPASTAAPTVASLSPGAELSVAPTSGTAGPKPATSAGSNASGESEPIRPVSAGGEPMSVPLEPPMPAVPLSSEAPPMSASTSPEATPAAAGNPGLTPAPPMPVTPGTPPMPASSPSTPATVTANVNVAPRLVVVRDAATMIPVAADELLVDSLAAAVQKIKDLEGREPPVLIDAIELRYNGDGGRTTPPLKLDLAKSRLTIRAGQGYSPVLVFHPQAGEETVYPREMIDVRGGDLTLEDVHLDLTVPQDRPVDSWSLIRLQHGDRMELRMTRCTMTVRYADAAGDSYLEGVVAFVDVQAPPTSSAMMMGGGNDPRMLIPITLQDCVARGEGTFLRMREVVPVSLAWHNGLLVTSERLLVTGGSSRQTAEDGEIKFDLTQLTAVVGDGLCRMTNSQNAPHQLTLDFHCANSVIVADPLAVLFEQEGVDTEEKYLSRLRIASERNFYQGAECFWRIRSTRSDAGADVSFSWQDWKDRWQFSESASEYGAVQWDKSRGGAPVAGAAAHLRTPDDYKLDEHGSNPAFNKRAGLIRAELPSLPGGANGASSTGAAATPPVGTFVPAP